MIFPTQPFEGTNKRITSAESESGYNNINVTIIAKVVVAFKY